MARPSAQRIGPWKLKAPSEIAANKDGLLFCDYPPYQDSVKSWDEYNREVLSTKEVTDEYFEFCNFNIGNVSESLANKLLISLDSLRRRGYSKNDCRDTYVASPISRAEELFHAKIFTFFNFGEEQLKLVKDMCEELKPTIESCLGTGFKVINVKACETAIGDNGRIGPCGTHTDAFPVFIQKALVYLTEASMNTGTTLLRAVRTPEEHRVTNTSKKSTYVIGPPGSFVFFNPNTIKHNGIPPDHGRKVILEITVCPSHVTEINPTFNGTNSRHPIVP